MTTNPARELADLLESWRALNPTETVEGRRGGRPVDAAFWRRQAHAVELLLEVDAAITRMRERGRRTDHYEEPLIYWYIGVFAPADVWDVSANRSREILPKHAVNARYGLADTLDGAAFALPVIPLDDENAAGIHGGIEDIETLLNNGGLRLPGAAEDYMRTLLLQARELLDASAQGSTVDLVRKLNELVETLYSVIESGGQGDDVTDRLRSAVRKAQPWTAGFVRFGARALEVGANVKELLG